METRQTGKSTRQKLNRFLDRRSHDWQQRLCLITFLMLSFATAVILIPMHIGGLIGRHGARPVSHAPPVSQHRGISFWHHDAAHGERTHHLPLHGAAGGLRTDYSVQPSHLPCPNHLPRHVGSEVDTAGDNHCQLRHYHIHLRQHRRCHKPPDSDNIRTRGSVHLRAGRTDKAWHTQPTDRERRLPHHNQPASRSFPHDQARTAILYTIGKGRHEWQRR